LSLDPVLQSGLDLYTRGDYKAAALAWTEACSTQDAETAILLACLASLASAAADPEASSPPEEQLELLSRRSLGLDIERLRKQLDDGVRTPELRPARRISKRAIARFGFLIVLAAAGFVALRWTPLAELADTQHMIELLEGLRGAWWSPLALAGLYALLSPIGVPATPLIAAGGVVFGVYAGSLLNFFGILLGATTSYWIARALGQELVEQVIGNRLRKVEHLVEKHGFWTLARLRFVPIPFFLFNFSCALSGIKFPLYLGSTAMGMALTTTIWTYFWVSMAKVAAGQQVSGVYRNLFVSMGALFLLTFVPKLARGLWRRRRLRELRGQRRSRSRS
jgi:uncharacterized membrane protein YdjX (TVP38/TMEM64 family)